MKGLILKDVKLILQNIKFIILILVIGAIVSLNQTDSSFTFIYISVIFSTLALNTLAYDDADKSIAFLMTLPVSRATYVKGKYIVSFMFSLLGALLAFIIYLVPHPHQALDTLPIAISVSITMLIFQMIMIPLRLKFGTAKSGVVIVIFAAALGGILSVCMAITKHVGLDGIPAYLAGFESLAEKFFSLNEAVIITVLCLLVCLLVIISFAVSFTVSMRIMKRREF